jgi:hypothetical protein
VCIVVDFLDARPGEVDVKEEEQDAEAEDGAVESWCRGEAVEEEVAVDLCDNVNTQMYSLFLSLVVFTFGNGASTYLGLY